MNHSWIFPVCLAALRLDRDYYFLSEYFEAKEKMWLL